MGTSATIAYERPSGEIVCIYCHWDGYLAYVGQTLKLHYKDAATIEKLMALGDLSCLGRYPEVDPDGWDYSKKTQDDNLCVNYRSRGDVACDASVYPDYESYMKNVVERSDVSFMYLFKDFGTGARWYYVTNIFPEMTWREV